MELTTEDKQRIEQEAWKWIGSPEGEQQYDNGNEGQLQCFNAGAEYATLYERQQQTESNETIDQILDKVGKDPSGMIYYSEAVAAMELYANQRLEAGRSEVVDEIKKIINHLKNSHLLTPTPHPDAPINFLQSLLDRLNSLKTK